MCRPRAAGRRRVREAARSGRRGRARIRPVGLVAVGRGAEQVGEQSPVVDEGLPEVLGGDTPVSDLAGERLSGPEVLDGAGVIDRQVSRHLLVVFYVSVSGWT
jgi:hypothetical protein